MTQFNGKRVGDGEAEEALEKKVISEGTCRWDVGALGDYSKHKEYPWMEFFGHLYVYIPWLALFLADNKYLISVFRISVCSVISQTTTLAWEILEAFLSFPKEIRSLNGEMRRKRAECCANC